MASTYSAIKCPNCSRTAIEDDYYKTGELFICCDRCGYNYSKVIEHETMETINYKEEIIGGHGVFMVIKKSSGRELILLDGELNANQIEEFTKVFLESEVEQENSYLIYFEGGAFTILLGNPPEGFLLPFEESQEKEIKETIYFSV
ncbi:hypothetical protein [Virgibacillus necropolis]|uniref:Uncharacterized protein n=1 Tax=Virgibacillus necropolis TaxID=163877 RepID=A0A221M8C5_9BACI|nr:hypothetical protein [Virgibacillus necropolis]ASN03881.1 hypothetical protein CFK40_02125 [Virgibacillus necropolis]